MPKHTDTQRTLVGDVRVAQCAPRRTGSGARPGGDGRWPGRVSAAGTTDTGARPGDPTHGVGENVRTRRRQVGGGPTLERAKSTHYRHAYQHVKRPEITRNPAPTSQTTVPESGAGGGWNVGPEPESTDIRCSKTWRSTANIDSSDLRSQCGGLSDLHCVPTA